MSLERLRKRPKVLDPSYFHPTRQLEGPALIIPTLIFYSTLIGLFSEVATSLRASGMMK